MNKKMNKNIQKPNTAVLFINLSKFMNLQETESQKNLSKLRQTTSLCGQHLHTKMLWPTYKVLFYQNPKWNVCISLAQIIKTADDVCRNFQLDVSGLKTPLKTHKWHEVSEPHTTSYIGRDVRLEATYIMKHRLFQLQAIKYIHLSKSRQC